MNAEHNATGKVPFQIVAGRLRPALANDRALL
jgi:hypothetical protein